MARSVRHFAGFFVVSRPAVLDNQPAIATFSTKRKRIMPDEPVITPLTVESPAPDAIPTTPTSPAPRPRSLIRDCCIFAVLFTVAAALVWYYQYLLKWNPPQTRQEILDSIIPSGELDPASSPLPPDVVFAQASPAVVQVVIQNKQGSDVGSGSGFLVKSNGYVATNYHVIKKAHSAYVVLADKTKLMAEGVAATDDVADIAIIKVAGLIKAKPLELIREGMPPIGAKVYAIGSPLQLSNTLSDGLVSGHRKIGENLMIQMTAPISPGSSGGPLIGTNGKVVGITTESRIFGNLAQNLNFALPASQLYLALAWCEVNKQLVQFPGDDLPTESELRGLHAKLVNETKRKLLEGMRRGRVDRIIQSMSDNDRFKVEIKVTLKSRSFNTTFTHVEYTIYDTASNEINIPRKPGIQGIWFFRVHALYENDVLISCEYVSEFDT
jgi:hypothetical protein